MASNIPLPASAREPLRPLPSQPDGVPWPTAAWPARSVDDDELDGLVDHLFADPSPEALGHTHALVVVQGGEVVVERYGTWFASELTALGGGPTGPVDGGDTHLSWSMAKSVQHAVCGLLAFDGRLTPDDRPDVPAWSEGADDPRRAITFDHLLQMRAGLQWVEEYYDLSGDTLPDVVAMLYDPEASKDMAGFAAGFPLVCEPGSDAAYNYSSGTSNIVAAATQRIIGGGEAGMRSFLEERLFGPLGMESAEPRFDAAGTFVASSYLYATALDFARFGLLYLRNGVWDGRRLLPEGWVDHARRLRSRADDDEHWYGAHWWADDDGWGTFLADGFEGQRILCIPALDVVLVRLGKTHTDHSLTLDAHLTAIAGRLGNRRFSP